MVKQAYVFCRVQRKLLLSFIKEGDFESFNQKVKLDDLRHSRNLLDFLISYKNQKILDFVYSMIEKSYQSNTNLMFNLMSATGSCGVKTLYGCFCHHYEHIPQLHWAILCNQSSESIENLLENRVDINKNIFSYGSPLQLAIQCNYTELFKQLLENNAEYVWYDDKKNIYTALDTAISHDNIYAVDVIYKYIFINKPEILNEKFLNDKLYHASQHGRYEVVKFLLDHGADVNHAGFLGMTPLYTALNHDKYEVIKYLVDYGADVNAITKHKGYKPLIVIAAFKSIEIVKLFLEKGANINAYDRDGTTALYIAAQENNINLVKFLLKSGADANLCMHPLKEKFSPLTMAAENGSTEIINALVDKGADVNHICGTGMTSLHYSVKYNHIDATKLLLEKGANINVKCKGKTPLDIAIENKNKEMVKLLCKQKLHYYIYNKNNENRQSKLFNLRLFDNKLVTIAKSLIQIINGKEATLSPNDIHNALEDNELNSIYHALLKK